MHTKFFLAENFVKSYKNKKAPFGFNGLGEIVYMRTYSRIKENGDNEEWYETVERVVNGTYNMQKRWIDSHGLGWNAWKAQKSAQEMYDRMFNMKFLPPGRGLWAMGTNITEEKGLFAALNNCSFISTEFINENFSEPFCFLMDMSMLGVGVGFDTRGENKVTIKGISKSRKKEEYQIADTREGWVESVKLLLEAYAYGLSDIVFDYSIIRKEGVPIKGFGGISSGSKPLEKLHINIREILDKEIGNPISVRAIVDLMNVIGKCVISGNVRRTAEIVFGNPDSEEYLDLKNYEINPERAEFGWTSNNSVLAKIGMDYSKIIERTKRNGEPGFLWLENVQKYSRIGDLDNKDHRAIGANPCCLIGNTLIDTNLGKIKIEDIVKNFGEYKNKLLIKSMNIETNEIVYIPIQNAFCSGISKMLLEIVVEEYGIEYKIKCTPEHLIYTKNRGYIEARYLNMNDDIVINVENLMV